METKDKKIGNFGVTIFLFILAAILLFFSVKQQLNTEKTSKELSDKISQKVAEDVKKELSDIIKESEQKISEYPDYFSIENLKKLDIVKNFSSWTPNASVDDNKMVREIILEKGNIAKGYIYIKTSINDQAFSSWESIYIKMNNVGGHLFRPNSLPIPKSDKTELLYTLDNISFLSSVPYSETKTPQKANWFDFFKDNNKIQVITFISSLKPAMIEEISLYYDCISGSDCLLTIK
jgi:transcription antitermination factor NusG